MELIKASVARVAAEQNKKSYHITEISDIAKEIQQEVASGETLLVLEINRKILEPETIKALKERGYKYEAPHIGSAHKSQVIYW
jgi:hypothetical protein